MSAQALPKITPEQYLEAERSAEFKSEYYGGQMYAMAGGTINGSTIAGGFSPADPLARSKSQITLLLARVVVDPPRMMIRPFGDRSNGPDHHPGNSC